MGIEIFKKHLREKRAVKVDAGICNLDLDNVKKIAKAAQTAKASALDICANKEVYKTARQNTKLPIFVSSLHPFEILNAVKWGADAVEIGNYSELYKKGLSLSADEIYNITLETLGLINKFEIFTCVTIPGCLEIKQQIKLLHDLEVLGVDMVAVEGVRQFEIPRSRVKTNWVNDYTKAVATTENMNFNTLLPIMTSGGIDNINASMAFEAGASAVSIDEAVSSLENEGAMNTVIMQVVNSISYRNSIHKEIIRTSRELSSSNKF